MLRSAFLKRMAFAALATWFVDLPLSAGGRPVDVAVGSEVDFRGVSNPQGGMTVYARWREPGAVDFSESVTVIDGPPTSKLEVTGDPTRRSLTMHNVIAVRGTRTLEEMRALAG